jgi:colanic acid/amylovoran biosynthesis glycosyltransferase
MKCSGHGIKNVCQEICQAGNFIGRKYDIVLCHFGPNGVFAANLMKRQLISGKLVTVFHGYDITTYLTSHGVGVYDQLFAAGDLFLPISERWKNKLLDLGCPDHKLVVHRMGIDVDKFSFRSREATRESIRLITVCRLIEKKGVEYGIRAVAGYLDKHPGQPVQYGIVGDGPLFRDLEGLIHELGRQDNIQLLGWRNQDEVAALMDEADIYLGPSVTSKEGDQEGIPVVLMEAMAKGLIVCATEHSGIPELIEDGVTGYLVPEADVPALSDKLQFVINNRDKWPEVSARAHHKVSSEYDIQILNDRLESLLDKTSQGAL